MAGGGLEHVCWMVYVYHSTIHVHNQGGFHEEGEGCARSWMNSDRREPCTSFRAVKTGATNQMRLTITSHETGKQSRSPLSRYAIDISGWSARSPEPSVVSELLSTSYLHTSSSFPTITGQPGGCHMSGERRVGSPIASRSGSDLRLWRFGLGSTNPDSFSAGRVTLPDWSGNVGTERRVC